MNYSPDDYLALLEAVEAQGGYELPDACEPSRFQLPMPDGKGGTRPKQCETSGCGQKTRFALVYDPAEDVDLPDTRNLTNTLKSEDAAKARLADVSSRPERKSPRVSPADAAKQVERGAGIVTVCAVDDDMARWPRFASGGVV